MLQVGDPGLEWHFIGPIQSNKTRYAGGAFPRWVQSVDRLKVAQRLAAAAPTSAGSAAAVHPE